MPLKAEAISKRTKTGWLLKDVSFDVADGEIFGILDSKSSAGAALTEILSGRDNKYSGTFSLEPADENAADVQYVGTPSAHGLLQRLRAAFRGEEPDQIRYAIEAAMTSNSGALLLAGAVLGAYRGPLRTNVDELIDKARRAGKIVIAISPFFEELMPICDRVAVLDRGEVRQIGTPQEIYSCPAESSVARSTGRCNLIEARRLSSSKAEVAEFQTIMGGHRLTVGKPERSRLGSLNRNNQIGIRPEHISIAFGASFPADNLLKALVTEVKFLGPHTIVRFDADGLKLEALVPRLVGLDAGGECMLALPPDRIMVFAD